MNGNLEANSRARTGFGRGFSFGTAYVNNGMEQSLIRRRAYRWRPFCTGNTVYCLCMSIPYPATTSMQELR